MLYFNNNAIKIINAFNANCLLYDSYIYVNFTSLKYCITILFNFLKCFYYFLLEIIFFSHPWDSGIQKQLAVSSQIQTPRSLEGVTCQWENDKQQRTPRCWLGASAHTSKFQIKSSKAQLLRDLHNQHREQGHHHSLQKRSHLFLFTSVSI